MERNSPRFSQVFAELFSRIQVTEGSDGELGIKFNPSTDIDYINNKTINDEFRELFGEETDEDLKRHHIIPRRLLMMVTLEWIGDQMFSEFSKLEEKLTKKEISVQDFNEKRLAMVRHSNALPPKSVTEFFQSVASVYTHEFGFDDPEVTSWTDWVKLLWSTKQLRENAKAEMESFLCWQQWNLVMGIGNRKHDPGNEMDFEAAECFPKLNIVVSRFAYLEVDTDCYSRKRVRALREALFDLNGVRKGIVPSKIHNGLGKLEKQD